MKTLGALALLCASLSCAVLPQPAQANPADDIKTPEVERGELEIGLKSGSFKPRSGPRQTVVVLGLERGITEWWSSEIAIGAERLHPAGTRYVDLEWENTFLLTEHGDSAGSADSAASTIDVGFTVELLHARDRALGDTLTFGPLLATRVADTTLNFNLLFNRTYGAVERTPLQLGYQAQVLHQWEPNLSVGLQAFGEVGQWDSWAPRREQSHRVGPALVGLLPIGGSGIAFDAALLFETSNRMRGRTLRLSLGYAF